MNCDSLILVSIGSRGAFANFMDRRLKKYTRMLVDDYEEIHMRIKKITVDPRSGFCGGYLSENVTSPVQHIPVA